MHSTSQAFPEDQRVSGVERPRHCGRPREGVPRRARPPTRPRYRQRVRASRAPGVTLARARAHARHGGGRAGARRRAGSRGLRGSPLLRLRHRRQPPRGPGRGLAHLGLGPERRPLRHVARGGRGGGGRGRVAARPARPSPRGRRRLRDGRARWRTSWASPRAATPCSNASDWNVEEEGLHGAPPVEVVVGEEVHVTILSALRMLGLGSRRARRVAVDGQGRMRPDDLARVLRECSGPTLVCAQAGNVNTGAFDPMDEIASLAREHGAWLHVDGAFGLWAASERRASPPRGGRGAGRLVGHRRAQVAERALRLRDRRGGRPRRAPGRAHRPRVVSGPDRRFGARPLRVGPRVLPSRARVHGLRRAPEPRAPGRRPDDRTVLPAGPAHGRGPGPRAAGPHPQRGGAQPGARAVRACRAAGTQTPSPARSSRACRATARPGSAARAGGTRR